MGPLWYEIMSNILPIVNPSTTVYNNNNNNNNNPLPPKFALFSGHDTTLMPLLASLGDKVWAGLEWAP
jgi:ubiquitin-like domain-containing CTD phosphatase 1